MDEQYETAGVGAVVLLLGVLLAACLGWIYIMYRWLLPLLEVK
jgi:hypothetical protein